MDDLAPAAAQSTSDQVRRTPEGNFGAPKKSAKKPMNAPTESHEPDPDHPSEPDPDHAVDVLA
jgi:hypothetical protein